MIITTNSRSRGPYYIIALGTFVDKDIKKSMALLVELIFNQGKRILYNGARYRCRIISQDRSRFIGTIVLRRAMNTKCGTYTGWFFFRETGNRLFTHIKLSIRHLALT